MGRRLANVVFMGMGEPLANEGAVWGAIERIHGDIGLSARHLTVSHGRHRARHPQPRATRPLPVNLAVSLHAANDELRNELVPINKRYPLDELMDACADYLRGEGPTDQLRMGAHRRRQRPRQRCARARRAVPRFRLAAHVNLIPLNPTPG